MAVVKETVKCPYCREPIAAEATRCKHCHAELTDKPRKRSSRLARLNTFRIGFLSGLVFCIVMAILIYFQFFAEN